jgi:hypothetical protein
VVNDVGCGLLFVDGEHGPYQRGWCVWVAVVAFEPFPFTALLFFHVSSFQALVCHLSKIRLQVFQHRIPYLDW